MIGPNGTEIVGPINARYRWADRPDIVGKFDCPSCNKPTLLTCDDIRAESFESKCCHQIFDIVWNGAKASIEGVLRE